MLLLDYYLKIQFYQINQIFPFLLLRFLLLYKIDYYTESALKDAKKAEKLDKTAKTAYWLSVVYARLGDMENAEKYSRIQSERIEQTIPKGDEQSGEG